MPLARTRTRRKRGKKADDEPHRAEPSVAALTPVQAQQIPAYTHGQGAGVPLLDEARQGPSSLRPAELGEDELVKERETQIPDVQRVEDETEEQESTRTVAPVSDVSGTGEEIHTTAYSLTLRGQTDGDFRSSFRTQNVRTSPGTGCEGCEAGDCVHVRGTLVSTYIVITTVTLPSVNDFPDLTPCQRRRVQDAITRVLAPHEQQHVRAFRTYNGTTRRPFDLTICRGDLDGAIQSMHDSEQIARQATAQARSDALDPFNFNVDLDCEEPKATKPRADAGTQDEDADAIV